MFAFIASLLILAASHTLPDCELEESTNCVWQAEEKGNGEGRSFVTINDNVYYLDK